MTVLLEAKEKLKGIYGKYDVFIHPLAKFIMAWATFSIINANIGYMAALKNVTVVLVLSLLGAILPVGATIVIAALVTVLQLYALSLEVVVIGILLFGFLFLVYFRFAPKNGVYVLLTPICLHLGIGPVMPVAAGLLSKIHTVISIICGTVIYYFLGGVKANAAVLGAKNEEAELTSKFTAIINQLLGNKEMYLVILAFSVTTIVVLLLRNLAVDYAWTIAIVVGELLNSIILFAGYVLVGIEGKSAAIVFGMLISVLVALVLQFLFFNVDYTRTERVQFEDDEYIYYVKAVPKLYVTGKEKQVKKFNTKDLRKQSTEYEDRKIGNRG